MRTLLIFATCLVAAVPAAAQISPFQSPVTIGERHRYDMDRLRAQSDQREAFALQQRLNARLTMLELQSARRPEPIQPESGRSLRTPQQERALREAAATRNRATVEGVTQIDGWLDRPRQ